MLTINSWWPWTHSPSPPGARGWIKLTPVTPSNYFPNSQSENHAQAVHVSGDFPPSLGFYKCFTETLQQFGTFRAWAPHLLARPHNKSFSAPNSEASASVHWTHGRAADITMGNKTSQHGVQRTTSTSVTESCCLHGLLTTTHSNGSQFPWASCTFLDLCFCTCHFSWDGFHLSFFTHF